MRKFDVRFCPCGTIHFLCNDLQNRVFFTDSNVRINREIMQICLNCGATVISGLDDYGYDEETDTPAYCHYSRAVTETMDGVDSEKYHIILSKGVRLMMESGKYASIRCDDLYVDADSLVEETGSTDLTKIEGVAHCICRSR